MEPGELFQAMWDAVRAWDLPDAAWRAMVDVGVPAGISVGTSCASSTRPLKQRK